MVGTAAVLQVWVTQLKVVKPRQQQLKQTLPHGVRRSVDALRHLREDEHGFLWVEPGQRLGQAVLRPAVGARQQHLLQLQLAQLLTAVPQQRRIVASHIRLLTASGNDVIKKEALVEQVQQLHSCLVHVDARIAGVQQRQAQHRLVVARVLSKNTASPRGRTSTL